MSKIRDAIGKIYRIHLDESHDLNTWFKLISVTGAFDQKRINETLIVLMQEVEDLRRLVDHPATRKEKSKTPVKR
jgi:hypothetical protein